MLGCPRQLGLQCAQPSRQAGEWTCRRGDWLPSALLWFHALLPPLATMYHVYWLPAQAASLPAAACCWVKLNEFEVGAAQLTRPTPRESAAFWLGCSTTEASRGRGRGRDRAGI